MARFPRFSNDGEAREFLASILRPGTEKVTIVAALSAFENAVIRRDLPVEIEVRVKDARLSVRPATVKPVVSAGKVRFDTEAPTTDLWITVRFGDEGRLRSWKFVYAVLPG